MGDKARITVTTTFSIHSFSNLINRHQDKFNLFFSGGSFLLTVTSVELTKQASQKL